MKVSDYIVDFLIDRGIADAFGIPGGVILELLYAMDRRKTEFSAHLCCHEQGAAFAACGYAQASSKPGVAYATRGPGVTNLITAIADAFYDSVPVLFLTAHAAERKHPSMRTEADQDMDPLPLVASITKYAVRIEHAADVPRALEYAYQTALSGRKGPTFLDFSSKMLEAELCCDLPVPCAPRVGTDNTAQVKAELISALRIARRPILLIGSGIHQSHTEASIRILAEKVQIPVLSSCISQDIMPDSPLYFGYIGSHGIRYSNFILSKADLIISFGNRMSVPVHSASFHHVINHTQKIRIDIDEAEFLRELPCCNCLTADLSVLLPRLSEAPLSYSGSTEWLAVCTSLKKNLRQYDIKTPVRELAEILKQLPSDALLVSDVGNHSFWLSRAYAYAGACQRLLYSKSFSALGCALPKAVGASIATGKPVFCFVGDQGFQFNLQELLIIARHRFPIIVILLNNFSSGMIRMREKQQFHTLLHTTQADGYDIPDFESIVKAYGLSYCLFQPGETLPLKDWLLSGTPGVLELRLDDSIDLEPCLPIGNPCQQLAPLLSQALYEQLDML